MKVPFRTLVLSVALMLVTSHHLRAPISEIATPTPTPRQQSEKPRPKSSPKPKPKGEASASATSSVSQQATKQARFAGTWVGTLPIVPFGDTATQVVVDPTETSVVVQDSRGKYVSEKTQLVGDTLQVFSTSPNGFLPNAFHAKYSITPEPDGKTARIRFQAFMNDETAIFRRVAE